MIPAKEEKETTVTLEGASPQQRRNDMLSPTLIEEIVRRYSKGQIPNRIAREMELSHQTVVTHLKKNGIYTGKPAKAARSSAKTQKPPRTCIHQYETVVTYTSPRGALVKQRVIVRVFKYQGHTIGSTKVWSFYGQE